MGITARAVGTHLAALLLAACATSGARPTDPAAERSAAQALRWLFAQQDADGGIRTDTYGVLRPGWSLTATALLATALLPEHLRAPHAAGIDAALAFLQGGVDADLAIGLHGDVVDYPCYTAAHYLHALVLLRPDGYETLAAQQIERLRTIQLTELQGWDPGDAEYGAFGFGTAPRGKPLGAGLSDVSLQRSALAALRAAGVPPYDPVVLRARRYVLRCQHPDGGFFFAPPGDPRSSKAGYDRTSDREQPRSYGTTTCDGIRALLACGDRVDATGLRRARNWLERALPTAAALARVPGLPVDSAPPVEPALRIYWLATVAATLRQLEAAGDGAVPVTDWRQAVCAALLPLQRADGAFVGLSDRMKEDDPVVATVLALQAIAAVLADR